MRADRVLGLGAALVVLGLFVLAAPARAQPEDADAEEPGDAEEPDDQDAGGDDGDDGEEPAAEPDNGYIGKRSLHLDIDDCPVPPDVTKAQLNKLAREHGKRGEVLYYDRGDYPAAIREFVAAYCVKPTAFWVLRNIGQAYERLLDFEKAVAYLERYVAEVPDKAKNAPELRRSTSARAEVLRDLKAQVSVATTPAGAIVSFTDEYGIRQTSGKSGAVPFQVSAGRYVMTVELPGHETVEQPIEARIGQPYSYFLPLLPRQGHLVVTAEPVDARIFVDDRLVGIGRYDDHLAGGSYEVMVEAQGRITESRRIEVVADRDIEVPVRLSPKPSSGRNQLLIGTSLAGGIMGSVALGVLETGKAAEGGLGFLGGVGVGFVGGYFGIPADIEVGHSSYILTTSVVIATEAAFVASLITDSDQTVSAMAIGGLAVGGLFGALTSKRLSLDAGDAALLNTGALWGGITGGLFATIFESKARISQALVLGGLNLGVITGALLGRQVEVSRRHVALIDLAGLAGMGISVSIQSAIDDQTQAAVDDGTSGERTANFALAGMAGGLALGAYLTRNMDAPKIGQVTPVMGKGKDASGIDVTTFGLRGTF